MNRATLQIVTHYNMRRFSCSLLALASLLSTGIAAPPMVEILSESDVMEPGSTLEFRFGVPMIDSGQVGPAAGTGPLKITPDVLGQFTWLSTRSGVFVPNGPLPLGLNATIELEKGLKAADGKPLKSDFQYAVSTPSFGVVYMNRNAESSDLQPNVNVILAYNADVELSSAESAFVFKGSDGSSIPAAVRYATGEDYIFLPPNRQPWAERWDALTNPKGPEDDFDSSSDRELPIKSRLVISPSTLLEPGPTWSLVSTSAVKSSGPSDASAAPFSLDLGSVVPFELTSIATTSYLNSGRAVTLQFSHPLAPDITPETAAKFFLVSPPVEDLFFEVQWKDLVARGSFDMGTEYTITVGPDVIAENGLLFAGDRDREFKFSPIAPRLYLPEITGHQILGGKREFPVLSVNLEAIQVTAKLVAPADVPQAIEAFRDYRRTDWNADEPDEIFQALPTDAIKGSVLIDEKIDLGSGVDQRASTDLDWEKILGGVKAGTIFVTVEGIPLPGVGGRAPAAQALIQLTDLGILWKQVADQIRVSVFSMATGKPINDAKLELLDREFADIADAQTGSDGLAEIRYPTEPAWLSIQAGADSHVIRIGPEGIELPTSAFGLPVFYRSWDPKPDSQDNLRILLFTDRPLYKPGETVHVKGILREVVGNELKPAAGRKGRLNLSGPRGNLVSQTTVETDDRGAFDTEVFPGIGSQGRYRINLEMEKGSVAWWDQSPSCEIEVTSYQPDAFEVAVDLPKRIQAGAPAPEASVTAGYFFGSPLTKAELKWTLELRETQFSPDGFENFDFGVFEYGTKPFTTSGEGVLSGTDPFLIKPAFPRITNSPRDGTLTVEVTDINQQTVSATRRFIEDASDFYLGIENTGGQVTKAGAPVSVRAIAVTPEGKPLDKTIPIKAELIQIRYEVVRVQGAGQAISFRNETFEEPVAEATGNTIQPRRQGLEWVGDDAASLTLTPPEPGQYQIRATATDAEGREVVSVSSLYVSGDGDVAWDIRNASQVDLIPDKSEYRVGETARVLIKTPISGTAQITIESGDQILREQTVELEGNAPEIEVPIEAGDAPNIFVSLMLIRGADESTLQFKMPTTRYGLCMLNVANPGTELTVDVEPAAKSVLPGEKVSTTITVLDDSGKPVRDASVTFYAIDDGVVSLVGYERPMPGPIFNALIPLRVRTGLSLFHLMPENPEDLVFENKGYLIGGGGMDGPGLKLRENFPGTACWFPDLRTNAEGEVVATFDAPDALTRYRLVAVAHEGANRFGSGESAISIAKPLMLLPSLGQFANVGDSIRARAVVRNQTGTDGTVRVDVTLSPGTVPDGETSVSVDIPNGESAAVDIPVTLRGVGLAEWTWAATMEAGSTKFEDRVKSTLEVGTPMVILRETYLSDLSEADNDLTEGVNPQLLEGTGDVSVTVSNTRLASLRSGATYLLEYPYGCAEQTVSALIPWIAAPNLGEILPGLPTDEKEIENTVTAGLAKLFSMQTPDGGIAFWPGGTTPSLFASAWAGVAMALLQEQGVVLPPEWEQLAQYLSRSLRSDDQGRFNASSDDRALAAYALSLADRSEPAYHEQLISENANLSADSRALVALAILQSGGDQAAAISLLNPKNPGFESVSPFGSISRDRAIHLLAWCAANPKSPEVAKLTQELLASRANGRWPNTQDNAWALLALSKYFVEVEKPKRSAKPTKGTIQFQGEDSDFTVSNDVPSAFRAYTFDPQKNADAPDFLKVTNPAKAQLYGETQFVVAPPLGNQPRQDRGYSVSRGYQKIGDGGTLEPAENLTVGDRILVTLRIDARLPGYYVAIDDPLPAVFEPVNPSFQSRVVGGATTSDGPADFREMLPDRVRFFCDRLPPGTFTFQYLARVRAAGEATAPATMVEEMYRPDRFGLGELTKVSSAANP